MGQVAAAAAVVPVGAEAGDEVRVVEQGQTPGHVIVLFGDEFAGGRQLLEQWADDAVRPDAKIGAQRLEVHIALEQAAVDQPGKPQEDPRSVGGQHETHRGQGRGLQGFAEQAAAGQQEVEKRLGPVFQYGRGLPHPAPVAHHLEQALHLAKTGELGGDALVGVGGVGQVVERQAIGAHTQVALVHRLAQQLFHFRQLRLAGLAADAALQAHRLHPQHGMGHEGADVRAQGYLLEMVQVVCGIAPGHRLDAFLQHRLGNVLHPGETVHDRVLLTRQLLAKAGTQAAVAHQHRGSAVAHHLGQARLQVHLQVEVGMDVQQPRQQPPALPVDHPGRLGGGQRLPPGSHPAVLERQVLLLWGAAATIEYQCVTDQGVPGCGSHRRHPRRRFGTAA